MSRQWIWGRSDIPPKCKLRTWEKQTLLTQADDQWIVIADDLTLPACFQEMRTNPWFHF